MFGIEKGTSVMIRKDGQDGAWVDFVTTKLNVFDKVNLVMDPTGISKRAYCPGDDTLGSALAAQGFYGFRTGNWVMVVHAQHVTYDGQSVL